MPFGAGLGRREAQRPGLLGWRQGSCAIGRIEGTQKRGMVEVSRVADGGSLQGGVMEGVGAFGAEVDGGRAVPAGEAVNGDLGAEEVGAVFGAEPGKLVVGGVAVGNADEGVGLLSGYGLDQGEKELLHDREV